MVSIILCIANLFSYILMGTAACPPSCKCTLNSVDMSGNCSSFWQRSFSLKDHHYGFEKVNYLAVVLHDEFIKQLDFIFFRNLTRLEITAEKLKKLNAGAFVNLPKLKSFALFRTQITEVPESLFKNAYNLASINISHNQKLESINENAFIGLPNLKTLDLSHNILKTVFETNLLWNLPQLMQLRLDHNRIFSTVSKIKASIGNSLTSLSLNHNYMYHLLSGMFSSLKNLRTLSIRRSYIIFILPNAFKGLHSLTRLYLERNQIRVFASDVFSSLRSLKDLTLQDNHMMSLPSFPLTLNTLDIRLNVIECSCNLLAYLEMLRQSGIKVKADCHRLAVYIEVQNDMSCSDLYNDWSMRLLEMKKNDSYWFRLGQGRQFAILFDFIVNGNSTRKVRVLTISTASDYILYDAVQLFFTNGTHLSIQFGVTRKVDLDLTRNKTYNVEVSREKYKDIFVSKILLNGKVIIYDKLGESTFGGVNVFPKSSAFKINNLRYFTKDCSYKNGGCEDICIYSPVHDDVVCSCTKGRILVSKKKCNFNFIYFRTNETALNFVTKEETKKWNFDEKFHSCTYNYVKLSMYCAKSYTDKTDLYSLFLKNKTLTYMLTLPYQVRRLHYSSQLDSLYHSLENNTIRALSNFHYWRNYSMDDNREIVSFSDRTETFAVVEGCHALLVFFRTDIKAIVSYQLDNKRYNSTLAKVIVDDLYDVRALAVDNFNEKIYWGDSYTSVIEVANLDGTCRKMIAILPSNSHISSMVFDGTNLIWLNSEDNAIMKTFSVTGQSFPIYYSNHTIFHLDMYKETGIEKTCVTGLSSCIINIDNIYLAIAKGSLDTVFYSNDLTNYQLPKKNNILMRFSLSKPISYFGKKLDTIYISPQGFISTTPNVKNLWRSSLIAVYVANTTNRFTGDVFVKETTDRTLCKIIERDIQRLIYGQSKNIPLTRKKVVSNVKTRQDNSSLKNSSFTHRNIQKSENISRVDDAFNSSLELRNIPKTMNLYSNTTKGPKKAIEFKRVTEKLSITHLVIITWIRVTNITNNNEQNTFQAVIASNDKTSYAVFNYEELGTAHGVMGLTYGDGKHGKLETYSSNSLNFTRRAFELKENKMEKRRFLLLRYLVPSFVALSIFVVFAVLIVRMKYHTRRSQTSVSSTKGLSTNI